eukprot:CAMPEP_0183429974 /NCGR_PEP_ID=MMETSP0370-20130417/49221_1 /TAXON_ID=268820 /ORGANISM="Peridinium aciculiferum, Strain PAER-2" /LENGTH=275 /DNA_ID=CAMNT_0025615149 /DNA_START=74 /DNA_END=901 /DNA_ORIENTATION=-
MTDSVYRKTPLPAKLNLNDRNTKAQLGAGAPETESNRGALEGVGCSSSTPAKQSQDDCNTVMRKELQEWLATHDICGPPPTPEAEQRAMWQWIRDFHKEYNDDWFARNMPRLHQQFKPVFMAEMRAMKRALAAVAAPAPQGAAANLLDFDQVPARGTEATQTAAAGADDLLSLDTPVAAPAAAAAVPAAAPSLGGGFDSLLDLGAVLPTVAPALATPAVAAAPGPSLGGAGGLFDLDFGGYSPAPVKDAGAMAPCMGAQAPAQQGRGGDLLDLVF